MITAAFPLEQSEESNGEGSEEPGRGRDGEADHRHQPRSGRRQVRTP